MSGLRSQTLLIAATLLVTTALTAIIAAPAGLGIQATAGEAAKATYRAPQTVTYQSALKSAEAEEAARKAVPVVYRSDLTAASQQASKFAATMAGLNAIRASAEPDKADRMQALLSGLSVGEANRLASLPEPTWQAVLVATQAALTKAQATPVRPEDLGKSASLIEASLPPDLSASIRADAILIGARLLLPNQTIDQEKTEVAQKAAVEAVTPISYTLDKDQVIAYRGQVLTAFDVERLQAAGLTRPAFTVQRTLGVALLVVLFAAFLLYVAPRQAGRREYPKRNYALVAGSAIGVTLAAVLIVPTQPILAYVVPVAAPALIFTIFYGFSFAIVAGLCLSALYALAAGGSFELFFIHLAATTGAILFAGRIRTISGFLRAGLLVALVVFIGMVAFTLLAGTFTVLDLQSQQSDIPKFLVAAALNGMLTATFVFAGVAFLGNFLGKVTFLQLLELENPRHPLLRKLSQEAPGTYSHSLRMASIVEKVAEDIGADSLLARVQTLYHDIGKTAIPEYFVENQRGHNLHEDMTPRESADILRAHISEGLTLAKQHRLPEEVAAAIPEHHGTTLMGFFWSAAKKNNKRTPEKDFRYLGPTPQSRETAIIMLADAVEAASRTLENPDEASIRALIHGLFTARLDDGQLDHAPLSTNELRQMREAFAEAVLNDMHKRIHYPRG